MNQIDGYTDLEDDDEFAQIKSLCFANRGVIVFPAIMGLQFKGKSSELKECYKSPQCPFRVQGMMLWGVTDESAVYLMQVGQKQQSVVASEEIPARFFATADTYESVIKALKEKGFAPPSWIRWETCMIGQAIKVAVKGPVTNGVLWGMASY